MTEKTQELLECICGKEAVLEKGSYTLCCQIKCYCCGRSGPWGVSEKGAIDGWNEMVDDDWTPVDEYEGLPRMLEITCLHKSGSRYVVMGYYKYGRWYSPNDGPIDTVLAYRQLPEPYEPPEREGK